jgi:hypothetical protein
LQAEEVIDAFLKGTGVKFTEFKSQVLLVREENNALLWQNRYLK